MGGEKTLFHHKDTKVKTIRIVNVNHSSTSSGRTVYLLNIGLFPFLVSLSNQIKSLFTRSSKFVIPAVFSREFKVLDYLEGISNN